MKISNNIKFLYLSVLLVGLFSFIGAKAEDQFVNSKIKEVTVYLSGARVYRTGNVNIIPGTNTIIFNGLSNQIDENSLEVLSNGSFQILSVNYGINELKTLPKPESIRKLENGYDSVKQKLEFMRNEKQALQSQLEALKANEKLGVNEKTVFIDDVDDWLENYKKKGLEIRNKISKIAVQEVEVSEQLEKMQLQMDRLGGAKKSASGEIKVTILATKSEIADFKINYFVGSANWTPVYNLRANKLTDPVNMDYDAHIYQTTGEEWKDVKLSLNTGNPTLGGNKPILNPLILQLYQPRPVMAIYRKAESMDAPKMAMEESRGNDQSLQSNFKDSRAPMATAQQGHTNSQFNIPLRYTIVSDGQPQQVRIQQLSLPATFEYSGVPKFDKDAFLEAKVSGWEQFNLLAGDANLFLEGTYVGKSYLDPIATGDTFSLSFGRDKKIAIERQRIQGPGITNKILSGSSKKETFTYELSVKNLKTAIATITLEDQIPVSQTKDIQVSIKETTGGQYLEDSGKINWKLTLLPGETKKVRFTYIVSYPKNKIIQNLNE